MMFQELDFIFGNHKKFPVKKQCRAVVASVGFMYVLADIWGSYEQEA